MTRKISRLIHAGIASAMLLAIPAQAAEQTIVVLDGSGSMWGQIDGQPKLEIARAALAEVLGRIPADTEIGLMAYGHNRKGDCDDIEMLVAPSVGAAPAILEAAGDMKFLGMTPLSAAVTRAAETLRHREQKATVVLITDGLETCKLDPCAVGTELEASGIDFTAHVVGFGLSAEEGEQVACLARNTGGSYFAAADAESLAQSLSQAVAAAPEPAPEPAAPEAELQAPDVVPMASRIAVEWTGPGAEHDDVRVVDPDANHGKGKVLDRTRIRPDQGTTVSVNSPAVPGDYQLQYYSNVDDVVLATRSLRVDPVEVSLSAPEVVPMASRIPVEWTGPGAEHDDVRVVDPDANHGKGRVLDRTRIRPDQGATVSLNAPAVPGDYQLQYYHNVDGVVLATRALRVDTVEVSLSAPDAVPASSRISVEWIGPGAEQDEVRVVNSAANHGKGRVMDRARIRPDDGNTVALEAPEAPGDYELVYYNNNSGRALATRPLTVRPAEVPPSPPGGR